VNTQFFKHTVERVYLALVNGTPKPESGTIESRLDEWKDGTVHSTRKPGRGQNAITHYELIEQRGNQSLIRLRLETGRKHQIRAHLAERGWPIVGDPVYGKPDSAPKLMLRAARLVISHPLTG